MRSPLKSTGSRKGKRFWQDSDSDEEELGIGDPYGEGNVAPQHRPMILLEQIPSVPEVGVLKCKKEPSVHVLILLYAGVLYIWTIQTPPVGVATLLLAYQAFQNNNQHRKALEAVKQAEAVWNARYAKITTTTTTTHDFGNTSMTHSAPKAA